MMPYEKQIWEEGVSYANQVRLNHMEEGIAAASIIVNVKGYGAIGDGVTNDTAAIQAALTANAGGIVFLPKGIYKTTAPLSVPPATSLIGAGYGSEVKPEGCHGIEYQQSNSIRPTQLADLALVGNTYEYDAVRYAGTVEAGEEVNSVNVQRVMLQHWRKGIYGRTIWRWNIQNNMFLKVWQPIEIHGQSVCNRAENNIMLREGATGAGESTGINVTQSTDYNPGGNTTLAPQDFQAHRNTIFGYAIGINSEECLLARYRDNDIDSCTKYGIRYAWTTGGLVIDGNWIGGTTGFACGVFGINLAATQPTGLATIVNNHITGEEGEPEANSIGIHVFSKQHHTHIEGNEIDHMKLYDIKVESVERAKVENNSCNSTAVTNSIYVTGTSENVSIDGNYVQVPIFVDPNEGTNAIVDIGDTYGAQSTRIRGKSVIKKETTEITTKYSELNGAPPNFIEGAPSFLRAHLWIEAPAVNLGALWGIANNEGVTIHCEKAPVADAGLRWEVRTQCQLD